MARITTQPPAEGDVIPGSAAAHIAQAQDALSLEQQQSLARVRAAAAQVGYQLPADSIDPDLVQRDIAVNMRRSVEACLEVGRGLVVLKAICGHGNFLARLEVLEIEPRIARRFMQAAIKFSNRALTPALAKAIGNQTKLFEMLVLDDEQIDELALTGETGELKLDDIATMSVKELREALRQSRHDEKFANDMINSERERADRLEKSLRKGGPEIRPLDERITPFQKEIAERQSLIQKALLAHESSIKALESWSDELLAADPEAPQEHPGAVLTVAQQLHDDIETLAAMVGMLQHLMHETFGMDIQAARSHLMQSVDLSFDAIEQTRGDQAHVSH